PIEVKGQIRRDIIPKERAPASLGDRNMETGTSTAMSAELTNVGDSVEKILKVVHEVENEMKAQKANFQVQLAQAIEETRHGVEEQCRAERERAVSAAKEATRREVTDNLLTR